MCPHCWRLYEREQDVDLRMYVIARMGEMPQPEPVLPTLLDALESGRYDLQQAALEALQQHQRLYQYARMREELGRPQALGQAGVAGEDDAASAIDAAAAGGDTDSERAGIPVAR
jgi:hypothetical protein